MSARILLINRRPEQRRVALIENGVTAELFFERIRDTSLVGNIYKGRVVRVLPGMQAAFVEIGLSRTAFLFVGDVARPESPDDEDTDDSGDVPEAHASEAGTRAAPVGRGDRFPPIDTLLVSGQQLLVQVAKMPLGTKGARISTHISLPGRHVVYMPTVEHVGVSRRITDPDERSRLRTMAQAVKPEEGGLIVRTAGEGLDLAALREDVAFLVSLWKDIRARALDARAPALIHEDLDLTLRSVRDLIADPDDRVVVDDDDEVERIVAFARRFMPSFLGNIQRWDAPEPMFERYGVEWEITRASRRKVWLKSGGYILIDRTEALTAIDVNTGRFVGKARFEDTVLTTNLEAVKEIAYQLRLRDIGGIVVIDFIDMDQPDNQQRVLQALTSELERDRAQTRVLPVSGLGLVEMTRKRVRNSIVESLTDACYYCEGKGYLRSLQVIADGLLLELHQKLRAAPSSPRPTIAEVRAHPRVTETLAHDFQRELERAEVLYGAEIQLVDAPQFHLERTEVVINGLEATSRGRPGVLTAAVGEEPEPDDHEEGDGPADLER
jgi:ribonuclease G